MLKKKKSRSDRALLIFAVGSGDFQLSSANDSWIVSLELGT